MTEESTKEKDLLEIIKDRIKAESKFGDKAKACSLVGISSTTYERGMSKEKYDDLTDSEEKVLLAHISILDDRAEQKAQKVRMLC